MPGPPADAVVRPMWRTPEMATALLALVAIAAHLAIRVIGRGSAVVASVPLLIALVIGAWPVLVTLSRAALKGNLGADFLAGLSIVTAGLAGEYLVAVVVILMWAGGQTLEQYAHRRASSALAALARRHPAVAHRRDAEGVIDVPLDAVRVGDELLVLAKEICPVDGVVRDGISTMDEAFISGEPYVIRKTVGSAVMSGAVNGDGVLTIVAARIASESRYAQIVNVVREAEARRPPIRRLADRLAGWYTPFAIAVAVGAWWITGDGSRFLAVLVVATPCPLLLGIPVSIIGGTSLAAERSILIRDPSVIERIGQCRTAVFDKTGTLTLGKPVLTDVVILAATVTRASVLRLAASLEQYSKHPLAEAIVAAADLEGAGRVTVTAVTEPPGGGLRGEVGDHLLWMTGRNHLSPTAVAALPVTAEGLECVVVIDSAVAALLRFRDVPRPDSSSFVRHLGPAHHFTRVMLVSGDRESEVQYLAGLMGISEVLASQTPEQKVGVVRQAQTEQPTMFVGDGLNDAPAMVAADVSVAIGHRVEIAANAAGAVILDDSLSRVDELLHIARRTSRIARQSALGGMFLSVIAMGAAAGGWLPAMAGVATQEAIDVWAVLNALRAAFAPRVLTDMKPPRSSPSPPAQG